MKNVLVKDFCKSLKLTLLNGNEDNDITFSVPFINRPGLQLSGFYDYFDERRVQILGLSECLYLAHLDKEESKIRLDTLFSHNLPCAILSEKIKEPNKFIESAKENNLILFKASTNASSCMNKVISYLEELFAPETKLHGVMVEVSGVGVLITGESGIGKSEVALELIKRGHRLVSDDMVNIKRIDDNRLSGSCPEMLKYFMEIRGIGILDIRALYGMGAIRENVTIDIIVKLERWVESKYYERVGIDKTTTNILDVECPSLVVPVVPGRNMAVLIETIARNFRVTEMHYDSSKVFCERIEQYNRSIAKKQVEGKK